MAHWNREQAPTQRFLSNDFQQDRWKTAALKNAYALLGKRRFGQSIPAFVTDIDNCQLLTTPRIRGGFLCPC